MKLIADFHIHSRYSRATSKELSPEEIDYWAKIKGLSIIGTGDFTHPRWFQELKEKLEPKEPGLYQLKDKYLINNRLLPKDLKSVRFVFTTEISCIYKKAGAVRKLHHLILAPSPESALAISKRLSKIGNLASDGRPILGLDSKNLLEILLETDKNAVLIPAHIWTPWFSLFGSMSGFDALEECFEDLTKEIFALETGLSSDPAMNRRLSSLDRYVLVSNSDAHSPKNLAREACLFDSELDYYQIINTLRFPEKGYLGTIEFFPEEGKYHFDGHRKCGICFSPKETKAYKGICPKCQKPLTIGVMNRVEELSDRIEPKKPEWSRGYVSLIPLAEIIGEILESSSQAKAVEREYFRLVSKLGAELKILLNAPIEEIEKEFPLLALAIERMRAGKVIVQPGFDGEYGRIKVFEEGEFKKLKSAQEGFFRLPEQVKKSERDKTALEFGLNSDEKELEQKPIEAEQNFFSETQSVPYQSLLGLSSIQRKAVESKAKALLIKAGPGTGKTRTLTHRIAYLIETGIANPEEILALTFTNKAKEEMEARLRGLIGEKAERIWVSTFHSLAYRLIQELMGDKERLSLLDELAREKLLKELFPEFSGAKLAQALKLISKAKINLISPEEIKGNPEYPEWLPEVYQRYQDRLEKERLLDFEELSFRLVKILERKESADQIRNRWKYIFVDEYQDLDYSQYQIQKKLVGESGTISVIGDQNQAIYGFRGASSKFFEEFIKDYPSAELIELAHSFRLSEQILKASYQALPDSETGRIKSGVQGAKLKTIELTTDRAEAEFIVSEIEKLIGGVGFFSFDSQRARSGEEVSVKSFGELAVLFRANAQIPALVEAFSRLGIPYQLLSESPIQNRFYKFSLWLLSILSGRATKFIFKLALKEIFPKEQVFPKNIQELKNWLEQRKSGEPAKILLHLLENAQWLNPLEVIDKIFSLTNESDEEKIEKERIKELVLELVARKARLEIIKSPSQVLELLSLASAQDFYDPSADRVSLLTIHSAKGLEFEVVFLAGCEEGIIPHISAKTNEELNEEARLFYVAMTRAKSLLYLTRAKNRPLFGKISEQAPSRFLTRISEDLKDLLKPSPLPQKPKVRQMDLFK